MRGWTSLRGSELRHQSVWPLVVGCNACSLLVAVVLSNSASAGAYSKMVVFGDSLSDVGNIWTLMHGAEPPSVSYWQGRYSNGPVWVEHLADDFGMARATPCWASSKGTNYAFAGATTPDLSSRIGGYLEAAKGVADSNALYPVWAGGNDFLYKLGRNPSNMGYISLSDIASSLSVWADNVAAGVSMLHAAGAVNFLIPNLPPLGSVPYVRAMGSTYETAVNEYSVEFNARLASDLAIIAATHSDVKITQLDVYDLFEKMLADPTDYGLTNVTGTGQSAASGFSVSGYLFWDNIHPTTEGHALVAQAAYAALTAPVPEPSSTAILITGSIALVAVVSARRRRG